MIIFLFFSYIIVAVIFWLAGYILGRGQKMKKIKIKEIKIKRVECPDPDLEDIIPVTLEQCKKCEFFEGFVEAKGYVCCKWGEDEEKIEMG